MKKIDPRLFFSIMVILAYLLSACSGVPAGAQQSQDNTGPSVSTELSNTNDANTNSGNENESNANSNASSSNDDQSANSNSANGNGNDNSSGGIEQEVSGVVEALTTESITINGVTYVFADFTEFKHVIALGDLVKLHVIVNADGTFTIREIEKSDATSVDDGNSNDNGSDDNSNSSNNNGDDNNNSNNNDNSNDDGGGNGNGNDDNGGDDNGNDNGGGGDDGGNGNG